MRVSRRTFLKGSAAAGGDLLASRFLYGPLESLVAGPPEAAALRFDVLAPPSADAYLEQEVAAQAR